MWISPSPSSPPKLLDPPPTIVAVLTISQSIPPRSTQFPALAIITSVRDRPRGIHTDDTVANAMSSSSSGVYASPSTLTRSPVRFWQLQQQNEVSAVSVCDCCQNYKQTNYKVSSPGLTVPE